MPSGPFPAAFCTNQDSMEMEKVLEKEVSPICEKICGFPTSICTATESLAYSIYDTRVSRSQARRALSPEIVIV